METRGKVLILGATGGIGGETARRLIQKKWDVRALKRGLHGSERRGDIQWVGGDALDPEQVAAAAADCSAIVHAVNPPGYRNWKHLVLPMLRNTIGAAERTGALIVLPDTVYNYGPDAFPLVREDAPQMPVTKKGAIRVQMEKELEAYSQRGGRVLILRAGDFFGPRAGNNWFSQGLIKPGKLPGVISNPGSHETGHQWAYLPDVAETIAALLERREELEPLGCRRQRNGQCDSTHYGTLRRRCQNTIISVVVDVPGSTFQRNLTRAFGDAVPVAPVGPPGQYETGEFFRCRASHSS